jgi:hypothetical protein
VKPETLRRRSGSLRHPVKIETAGVLVLGANINEPYIDIANGAISVAARSQSSNVCNLGGPTLQRRPAAQPVVVWELDVGAYPSGPAVLTAYDATNVANQLYSSPTSGTGAAGSAVKFAVLTVANGKVYVGTQGQLDVFGLL